MRTNLHERIAARLGWSVQDVASLSMLALRDLVRPIDAKLAADITTFVAKMCR